MMDEEKKEIRWEHTNRWRVRRASFLVEIVQSRHTKYFEDGGEMENLWNVYVYIYPSHPLFARAVEFGNIFSVDALPFEFHGGCSYLQKYEQSGEAVSVCVGCDYNHLHDQMYTEMNTREEAAPIFADAEQIVRAMEGAA